jgi:hypothetical protein
MLEITPKGQQRLLELQAKERNLEDEFRPQSRPWRDKRLESAWRRVVPYLSILWELDQHGPRPREYFYWNREQPLQEGYIKVHDRARNRVIDELIAKGYVTETAR